MYPLLRERRRPRIRTKIASWVLRAPTLEARPLFLVSEMALARLTKLLPGSSFMIIVAIG